MEEQTEVEPLTLIDPRYEADPDRLQGIKELAYAFYNQTVHDLAVQWKRVSAIGKIAVELLFQHDLIPRLEGNRLLRINVVVPMRGGVPFFDANVAAHLQGLVREAGYRQAHINFVPVGVKRDTVSGNSDIYYIPYQHIGELKIQKGVWVIWDFGNATGQTIADVALHLMAEWGIDADDILLRTGIVTQRGAQHVKKMTGIDLIGFLRCKTGGEVGLADPKQEAWVVEIENQRVNPRDWGDNTIGSRGEDTHKVAVDNIRRFSVQLSAVCKVLGYWDIPDSDISYLEHHYRIAYEQARLQQVGIRAFIEETRSSEFWNGYSHVLSLLVQILATSAKHRIRIRSH